MSSSEFLVFQLRITNSRTHKIDFVLEPWGEIYQMAIGDCFDVSILAPNPGTPDIFCEDQSITLYCWSGSTVVLKNGDVELGAADEYRTPVPG